MAEEKERPIVYEYDDFQSFLRDFIEYARSVGQYSNRKFAEEAGFKSHSYVLMVLAGKRRLTEEAAQKVARGLKLNDNERDYFCLLCKFNQTSDPQSRKESFEKLISLRTDSPVDVSVVDQYDFYSNWYHAVIYESLSMNHEEVDLMELSQELELEESDVQGSLELLERLKLIDKQGESYRKTTSSLQTLPEANNLLIREFHRTMIEKATEAIDTLPTDQRDLSSLTVSMSPRIYSEVTEKIRNFRNEMNDLLSKTPERGSVYQLNIQFFPLLTPIKEDIH